MQPGTLLTPTIRLVKKLGQGGMGSVWVADHLALHTQVAVKLMMASSVSDELSVERFASEAKAAARIRSPHVAQVFDHGVTEGTPYIVMELLDGEDLQALLARRGSLTLVETVHIVRQ